uniref:Uncharacterized protein n=1 Tax=Tanacetum cinerariifolium TaxID=118510 RepID=A0A6L2KSI9_TANCI|nr:hypothetical protein [Tanacetum cinerariifolium]
MHSSVLDGLALTPCYSIFHITVDVLEVYMHQFWDSVYKHGTFYRIKIDKRKRFKLTLEIFRDIFKIFLRIQGQEFDALPTNDEIVSFLKELGHTEEINSFNDELRTEDARFKEVRKKSIRDFHKTHPSGSGTVTKTTPSVTKIKPSATSEGTGVKPRVLDVAEEESSENSDDEKTQSDNKLESDSEHETNESESGLVSDHHERNENLEILQVIEYAHVTLSTVPQKIKVPITNSSHLSDLATKFSNFSDIPHANYEIVSPLYVHVHHEIPSQQTPTLLTVPVSVISDSSPVFSTVILQSLPFFIPPPQQSSPTPPPITEAINPQSALPNFASVFQFNNRVTTLEKKVAKLKKDDPIKTQVTALVDKHLDARLGATKDEFMNFLLALITTRITYMVSESLEQVILIDKMDKSESYLAAPENRDCFKGLKKSFDLDKTFFSTYGKVYSLKRSQKHKDIDEDPSVGSDRGLKKKKTRKDVEPSTGPKSKESQSSSSKGNKSKSKSSRKSIQSEEPKFEVADSDMPHDQEENLDNDNEPKEKVASKRDWFTKPTQPQEPTDPD